MPSLSIEELPYRIDSAALFACIADLELPVFLDSAAPYCARGRYDIVTAQPLLTLVAPDRTGAGPAFLEAVRTGISEGAPALHNDYHLPFLGGALGYFGYDFARTVETLPDRTIRDLTLPPALVGIYSWAIIVDHRQQRSILLAQPTTAPGLLEDIRRRLQHPPPSGAFRLTGPFASNLSGQQYRAAFDRVQGYIQAGDCYQINLAQRFSAPCEGSPWAAYLALRKAAAAPFSAFMDTGEHAILSLSPERFLHVGNHRVTTSPIKGTRKRGATPEADQWLARQLLASGKDRAENLMIVDLLRNDLGKVCRPGTIQVDELFGLQSFETVHHLVSTLSGELRPDCDALQLLAGCFPGGSITGAPKIRAMQIIEELEPCRRSVYCGAIGYISCDGQMDSNIAIRTLLCDRKHDHIHCWSGGGIVADSDCDGEFEECISKVGPLLRVLGGMGSGEATAAHAGAKKLKK